jgi:hypothetical protein
MRLAALVLLLAGCAGCAWRLAAPAGLDEVLAVRVVADRGRLPLAGAEVQQAVAEAVPRRTGWILRGDGSARLDLTIDRDEFAAPADDARGVAVRWSYRIDATALLVTRDGVRTWRGSGTGYAGARAEEHAALRDAARDLADRLARWLAEPR